MDRLDEITIHGHVYRWMKRGYYERIVSAERMMDIFVVVPIKDQPPEKWRFSYSRFNHTPTGPEYTKLIDSILERVENPEEMVITARPKPSLVVVN